jgi:hypothetical protein
MAEIHPARDHALVTFPAFMMVDFLEAFQKEGALPGEEGSELDSPSCRNLLSGRNKKH